MGFRFYKSVSIGKGLRAGVSKSGVGLSFGAGGARYSVHSSGRTRKTVGIPGTGLSYQQYGSLGKARDPGGAIERAAAGGRLAAAGEDLTEVALILLVAGSGITFEDRGSHELKGVPGEWRLYAVRG